MATAIKKNSGIRLKKIPGKFVVFGIHQETITKRGGGVYDGTRWAWRANIERARRSEFVIAVELGTNGKIIGVFVKNKWYHGRNGRIYFRGTPSPNALHKSYIGNFVPQNFVPVRNPVRYSY